MAALGAGAGPSNCRRSVTLDCRALKPTQPAKTAPISSEEMIWEESDRHSCSPLVKMIQKAYLYSAGVFSFGNVVHLGTSETMQMLLRASVHNEILSKHRMSLVRIIAESPSLLTAHVCRSGQFIASLCWHKCRVQELINGSSVNVLTGFVSSSFCCRGMDQLGISHIAQH